MAIEQSMIIMNPTTIKKFARKNIIIPNSIKIIDSNYNFLRLSSKNKTPISSAKNNNKAKSITYSNFEIEFMIIRIIALVEIK